jgi:hypothetical protein
VGSGADDHAQDNTRSSDNGHPSATDNIREGAGERAYGRETEQVRQDEPDPTVRAT